MRFIVAACLVLVLLTGCASPGVSLVISGEKGARTIEIASTDVIECSFVHSVELTPWIEVYRVQDGGLVLVESRTQSFGWGMPSDEPGYSFEEIGGQRWFVFRMSRPIGSLVVAVDPVNDYTLTVRGERIKLAEFGRYVRVSVDSPSVAEVVLGACRKPSQS